MKMKPEQLELIRKQLKRLMAIEDGFYAKKLQGIDVDSIDSQEAFEKLPYSDKNDLRDAYPLGLQAVERPAIEQHFSPRLCCCEGLLVERPAKLPVLLVGHVHCASPTPAH